MRRVTRPTNRAGLRIMAVSVLTGLTTFSVVVLPAAAGAASSPSPPGTALEALLAKLHDPTANNDFGLSVAVSGTTAVVGAEGTESRAGVAYIYVKGASGWPTTPTAKLQDPAATAGDDFGISVAVSGTTAVVGAAETKSGAGAAYIYVKGASGWPTTPTAKLSDGATAGNFGYSVAVSGTTAVVSAVAAKSSTGAAYIYVKGASGWSTTPTAKLQDPAATAGDFFGFSVAVTEKTAVVGAGAAGTKSGAGAAYIYVKGASGWPTTPTTELQDPAANANDGFGLSVAVSGTTAVVGADDTKSGDGAAYIYVKGASGWPTTPTAKLSDGSTGGDLGYSVAVSEATAVAGAEGAKRSTGAASIYVKGASVWPTKPTAELKDPLATSGDFFGVSVAVSETTALVGAQGTKSHAGAAYIYIKGASGWPTTPTVTLSDPEPTADDVFGSSEAVSGRAAVVGAYGTKYDSGAA